MTSDVSHCVRVALNLIKIVLSKNSIKYVETIIAQSLQVISERHVIAVGHI